MANRRRAPVLLELIKRDRPNLETVVRANAPTPAAPASPAPPPPRSAPVPPSSQPTRAPVAAPAPPPPRPIGPAPLDSDQVGVASIFSPGRTVRVPMGYLFFVAAGIVAIFVIGWALGHQQAVSRQKRARAAEAALAIGASRDPYLDNSESSAAPGSRPAGQASPPPTRSPSGAVAPQGRVPAVPPPPAGDPRQPGQNYLVVARADKQNSDAVSAFLRQSGLEAVTVPDDNRRFHLVVIAQGFPSGDLGSAEAKRLKNEVERLGRIWKRDHRGYTDFSDAYFKLQK